MKFIICLFTCACIVSCSSSPFQEETNRADALMEHLAQGVKYSGGNFPDKYEKSGTSGRCVIGVGKSVQPLGSSEEMNESAAISNAKFSLINSAPTTFESVVQKALGTELGQYQEFSKTDYSITKVNDLKGIEVRSEDVLCKIRIEPTESGSYKNSRECRALARVKVSDLKDAYDIMLSSRVSKKTTKEEILRKIGSE